MSAATVVFTDIVGFSRKSTTEQHRLVNTLTAEVVYELRPLLSPVFSTPTVLCLPTGDGMCLAFLHTQGRTWDRCTVLRLVLRLHRWARDETTRGGPVSLRIGVHVGAIELITDINGRPNVCGDTINYAQRVMDAANPRQTLLSETAFREHFGPEMPQCTITI